jgi:hypothetical protein
MAELLKMVRGSKGKMYYMFFCPACNHCHVIDDTWAISDMPDSPTVRPSVLVNTKNSPYYESRLPTCHLFIMDGKLQYLSDCTHAFSGKTVSMQPI